MIRNIFKKISGFTLVELLVVVVVIAVLAAVVLPKFVNSSQRSKESALKSDLKLVRNAIELFHNDTGAWPAALGDLVTLPGTPSGFNDTGVAKTYAAADWRGPYLQSVPLDPVSQAAFTYSVASGTVGKLSASATGNDSSGVAYSTY